MLTINAAASILGFLATASLVSAHGHVAKWTVNGKDEPGFNPSNALQYGPTANRPTDNGGQGFTDHTSGIVACGGASAGTGVLTWDVDAGSTVTAHWDQWPESHKGSVAEYMARCPGTTCDGVAADSLDWFKIDEADYDATTKKWPTEIVTATRAWSFKIPADLAAGYVSPSGQADPSPYLVRHDLLAMHSTGAPQVYPVCFQANLIGSGSAIPADTVKFPAAYKINTDFETWSLYGGDQSAFVPPGPAVYGGGGGGAAPAPAPVPASSSAAAPASSSAAAPVESSAAPAPSTAPVDPEYPAEPIPSSVASVPSSSAAGPVPTMAPADPEYPEEPVPSSAAPVVPSSAAPAVPSSAAAPPAASSTAPAPVTPPAGGALGGPAPAITKEGDKFIVNGGSYNFEGDAKYASCMSQMNKCKNWANSLPNAEVGPAFSLCDSQAATCFSGGSRKRDVINRYSKRALVLF